MWKRHKINSTDKAIENECNFRSNKLLLFHIISNKDTAKLCWYWYEHEENG